MVSVTGGLGKAAELAEKLGADNQVAQSGAWGDRSENPYRVGDRVVANCHPTPGTFCRFHGRGGTVTDIYGNTVIVKADNGGAYDVSLPYWQVLRESFIPQGEEISEDEEPIPFEITERADEALEIFDYSDKLADLVTTKREDYGERAIKESPWGWEIALGTRLHEKYERIVKGIKNNNEFTFEDLAESFKDLAGLALLGWIYAEKDM